MDKESIDYKSLVEKEDFTKIYLLHKSSHQDSLVDLRELFNYLKFSSQDFIKATALLIEPDLNITEVFQISKETQDKYDIAKVLGRNLSKHDLARLMYLLGGSEMYKRGYIDTLYNNNEIYKTSKGFETVILWCDRNKDYDLLEREADVFPQEVFEDPYIVTIIINHRVAGIRNVLNPYIKRYESDGSDIEFEV